MNFWRLHEVFSFCKALLSPEAVEELHYIATCVGLSGIHNAPPIAVSLHLVFPLLPRRRTSQDEEHEELPNQHGRSEKCCAAVTPVPRPLICCDQTVSRDVSVPISLLQAVHTLHT